MSAPLLLLVGLLGGAAACARFAVDAAITARTARGRRFPLGILAVNLGGALGLGVVAGVGLHGDRPSLIATGLLGSFTTFSTWMLDTHRLARGGRRGAAALNLAASLALGLLAVWLGRALGQAI